MSKRECVIRQFRQDDCLSYVVFDRPSRQAMIVDPRLDLLEDYRRFLNETGCRLLYSIDTRLQADHLSAAHAFASSSETSQAAQLLKPARSRSQKAGRVLQDGDRIVLGDSTFTVMEAPGSSEDSIAIVAEEWALTGDALWPGTAANLELPGSNPSQAWETFRRFERELSSGLLIYPGHDRLGLLFSTLEIEKRRNPIFSAKTPQELADRIEPHRPSRWDADSEERLKINSSADSGAGDALSMRPGAFGARDRDEEHWGASRINVEKLRKKLDESRGSQKGTEFIDVREPSEFSAGHIEGMRNLPLADLGSQLNQLRVAKRVYVSCLSGMRSAIAARTLAYVGLKDVVIVTGGLNAWNQAGFPVTEK